MTDKRKPVPTSNYPTRVFPNKCYSLQLEDTYADRLKNGLDTCDTMNDVWYKLFLSPSGSIIGVVDEEFYANNNWDVPEAAKQPNTPTCDLPACKVEIEIGDDVLLCLLCSAFEGGSNSWYYDLAVKAPPAVQQTDEDWHPCEWAPVKGGSVSLKDSESDTPFREYILDRAALIRGIQLMATKCPWHFANVLTGDEDAETGDAFLQLALFGELIYG